MPYSRDSHALEISPPSLSNMGNCDIAQSQILWHAYRQQLHFQETDSHSHRLIQTKRSCSTSWLIILEGKHHLMGRSWCQRNQTESTTNSRSSNCLFTSHMQIPSQFRKPSSPLKQTHPKYITSPPCVPIACTRQGRKGVGSFMAPIYRAMKYFCIHTRTHSKPANLWCSDGLKEAHF